MAEGGGETGRQGGLQPPAPTPGGGQGGPTGQEAGAGAEEAGGGGPRPEGGGAGHQQDQGEETQTTPVSPRQRRFSVLKGFCIKSVIETWTI